MVLQIGGPKTGFIRPVTPRLQVDPCASYCSPLIRINDGNCGHICKLMSRAAHVEMVPVQTCRAHTKIVLHISSESLSTDSKAPTMTTARCDLHARMAPDALPGLRALGPPYELLTRLQYSDIRTRL
ncbi:hypothetical protein ACJJTC_008368 [Scirpophaga incertulas]